MVIFRVTPQPPVQEVQLSIFNTNQFLIKAGGSENVVKNGRKGILLGFGPIIWRSFDRFDVFWPIMGKTARGFMPNLKNSMRAQYFWEKWRIFKEIFFLNFIHKSMGVLTDIFDIDFRFFISFFTFTTFKHI